MSNGWSASANMHSHAERGNEENISDTRGITNRYSVYLLFLLSLILSFSIGADTGGSTDCLTLLEDIDKDDDDGWAITTKRLCTSYTLPDWKIDRQKVEFTGTQFCMIAYEGDYIANAGSCSDRDMYSPVVKLSDNRGNKDQFYLTDADDKSEVPVLITLKRVDKKASYPLSPNVAETLEQDQADCVCNRNEYTFYFEVDSDKIFNGQNALTSREYTGDFSLEVWNEQNTNYKVSTTFKVTLKLQPAIQISGLEDITLVDNNGSTSGKQNFCVFAVGVDTFSLGANSATAEQFNDKHFRLGNNANGLKYTMTIEDSANKSNDYFKNKNNPVKHWTPSNQYQCNYYAENNMTLTITLENTDGPAGVYNDKMTLTVTPN